MRWCRAAAICLIGFLPLLYGQIELPPSATEVAASTGVLPLFERLQNLAKQPAAAVNPWELLYLRQQIVEEVQGYSLQVDATMALIDNEIAQARELRGYLEDKRDRNTTLINLSGIAAGGTLGIVSSALQLSPHLMRAGNVTGIVSGALVATISVIGLKAQKGKERKFTFPSNMLARLFNQPSEETSQYAPAVWQFLTSVAPTDPDKITRQARLIRTWVQVGRIDAPDTDKGKQKIERVTSRPSNDLRLTIDDLGDREAMLEDLRAKLSFMKRDLGVLMQAMPKNLPIPSQGK